MSMKRKRAGDAEPGTSTPKKAKVVPDGKGLEDELAVATPEFETPSKRKRGRKASAASTPVKANGSTPLTNGHQTPSSRRKGILSTPKKSHVEEHGDAGKLVAQDEPQCTPKSSGRAVRFSSIDKGAAHTPRRKIIFSTPTKPLAEDDVSTNGTPALTRNADRSAHRKSTRKLIEHAITGDASDEDVLDEEDALAQQILDEERYAEDSRALEEDAGTEAVGEESALPETPSKRGRGRPKGSRNKRLSTPPDNLPPHELYFFQNRQGGTKTSSNTFPSQQLLDHDKYFAAIKAYQDPHEPEKEFLLSLHSRSFDQWGFELRNGFNICLYGYGSKRSLALDFAEHQHRSSSSPPKTVVVNGYASGLTPRDVLTTILTTLLPKETASSLPAQPAALLSRLITILNESPPPSKILLIIASVDAPPFRRPALQSLLPPLSSHPSISLLITADTPNFPLLWDVSARAALRLLFHDCTTFAPFSAEIDAVDATNEVLGRRGRGRLAGRDGVAYVLRSLPENARALFRVLVAEQLKLDETEDPGTAPAESGGGGLDDDVGFDHMGDFGDPSRGSARRADAASAAQQGVEYRVLYHKAVESFICSSEMAFRTLLKEFQDHAMVEARRDAAGVERLWVPFRREEMEQLTEELEAVEGI